MLKGVRSPDHIFYFTLRDALNFGVQEPKAGRFFFFQGVWRLLQVLVLHLLHLLGFGGFGGFTSSGASLDFLSPLEKDCPK